MLKNICFFLIVYTNYLELYTNAQQYQYLGLKNVNQMEPPSLESAGILMGVNYDPYSMDGQGNRRAGRVRSLNLENKKKCTKKPTNGWKPVYRSLLPKKRCKPKIRMLDEQTVAPEIKMIDRKKEEGPMQEIKRVHMHPQDEKEEEKDLKPNFKETIETYTEKYIETTVRTIVKTRRRIFVQKRKIVNQRVNNPIMIIRRKVVKERQVFERIIPKIIETREIINNPTVRSKVLEGPIYEITTTERVTPRIRALPVQTTECPPEIELDANGLDVNELDGETIDGDAAVFYANTGYSYLGKK